jgi:hypothetical protein
MEDVMSEKTPARPKPVKPATADALAKNRSGIELTERELDKATGGTADLYNLCATGKHITK